MTDSTSPPEASQRLSEASEAAVAPFVSSKLTGASWRSQANAMAGRMVDLLPWVNSVDVISTDSPYAFEFKIHPRSEFIRVTLSVDDPSKFAELEEWAEETNQAEYDRVAYED